MKLFTIILFDLVQWKFPCIPFPLWINIYVHIYLFIYIYRKGFSSINWFSLKDSMHAGINFSLLNLLYPLITNYPAFSSFFLTNYHSYSSLDSSLFARINFFTFFSTFCFGFVCCVFPVSQMASIFFNFSLSPCCSACSFSLTSPLTQQRSVNPRLPHSVCFLLHLFPKSTSSFNIASSHISLKVFSLWILADDTSGIQIFPENKTHPTVSATILYCPYCHIPTTNVLIPYIVISSYYTFKVRVPLIVGYFFLFVGILVFGTELLCHYQLSILKCWQVYQGIKRNRSKFGSQSTYFKALHQDSAFHSYHIQVWQ